MTNTLQRDAMMPANALVLIVAYEATPHLTELISRLAATIGKRAPRLHLVSARPATPTAS